MCLSSDDATQGKRRDKSNKASDQRNKFKRKAQMKQRASFFSNWVDHDRGSTTVNPATKVIVSTATPSPGNIPPPPPVPSASPHPPPLVRSPNPPVHLPADAGSTSFVIKPPSFTVTINKPKKLTKYSDL
mmetsp:Transcript_122/g.147  ORF Transcript_122/g.147 Transcript_122/m.147 type:complete len:130 (-) Transcript_122:473-862(-)